MEKKKTKKTVIEPNKPIGVVVRFEPDRHDAIKTKVKALKTTINKVVNQLIEGWLDEDC